MDEPVEQLTVDQVKNAYHSFRVEVNSKEGVVQRAASAVGSLRPRSSEEEIKTRQQSLDEKKERIDNQRRISGLQLGPSIQVSDRKVSEQLDAEKFILFRLLTTGEYRRLITPAAAAKVVGLRWAREVFPDGVNGPNLQVKDFDGNLLPEGFIQEVGNNQNLRDQTGRRREFYLRVAKDPKLFKLREQVYRTEIFHLEPEEYEDLVAEAVLKKISDLRNRDLGYGENEAASKGLEMEIYKKDNLTQPGVRINLEAMQELGVPVTYDGCRELPLPWSVSMRDQLRALYEMIKAGVIPVEYSINFHLNFGGADWHEGLEDAFVLQQIIDASGMMNAASLRPVKLNNGSDIGIYLQGYGEKELIERVVSPRGQPVRIRMNGVLELRHFQQRWADSQITVINSELPEEDKNWAYKRELWSMFRDLNNIGAMVEAATASIRLKTGKSSDPERDTELARVWEIAKLRNLELADKFKIDDAKALYADIKKDGKDARKLETRFSKLRWEVVKMVKNSGKPDAEGNVSDITAEYRGLVKEIKTKVRSIEHQSD